MEGKPLGLTEVALRDGHQSLLATRLRIADILPIAPVLDKVGFWSLETWGGATFDACIRFLGEDPWERLRQLKAAMPNTRQQMLLRGQNLLGYRHYADDLVEKFVERAVVHGIDVFRIFDALNDTRNLQTSIAAAIKQGAHAQGTMAYTISPVHTMESWLDMALRIEDMGAHSLCIKDMAGLLHPYVAFDLISALKERVQLPVHMQCHATTGLSTATYLKAVEAGVDNLDTSISSLSMTYGHTATETMISMLQGSPRDTGLSLDALEEVATWFRQVRKKYARFEGELKGVDARILIAQAPGGMLSNMENQLRGQNALDKFDQVIKEIPHVRRDLGYIPLVTPTSQIVSSQAVLNVLAGQRYLHLTKETKATLAGEYGATPAAANAELKSRALEGREEVTCRPADLLEPEFERAMADCKRQLKEAGLSPVSAGGAVDDALICALFPEVGLRFLCNRNNPDAFEPPPGEEKSDAPAPSAQEPQGLSAEDAEPKMYQVRVGRKTFEVEVLPSGAAAVLPPSEVGEGAGEEKGAAAEKAEGAAMVDAPQPASEEPGAERAGVPVVAPLAGEVRRILVSPGQEVGAGESLLVLEALKMDVPVQAPAAGRVSLVSVRESETVKVGQVLVLLG